jgi:predicted DNA-binding protein
VKKKTEAVASRVNVELKNKLERAAAECGVSISTYLEFVIEDHITRNPNELMALRQHSLSSQSESEPSDGTESTDSFFEEMLNGLE